MPACAAVGCASRTENGVLMFCFPSAKEPIRKKRWEIAVNRLSATGKLWTSTRSQRLCKDHFEDDAFEKVRVDGKLKLKRSAVPTIFRHKSPKKTRKAPTNRNPPTIRSSPCTYDFPIRPVHDAVLTEHSYHKQPLEQPVGNSADVDSHSEPCDLVVNEIDPDHTCTCTLSSNEMELRIKLHKKSRRIRSLKKAIRIQEQKFRRLFTSTQLSALGRKSTRGLKWDIQTVKKGLQAWFACGATGYEFLIEQGLPYPSIRTLQRRLSHLTFKPGVLDQHFSHMKLKVEKMKTQEKLCCLTLDECDIAFSVEYDQSNQSILGNSTFPDSAQKASKALVFMLSGITTRWKQVVAYHYTGASLNGALLKPLVFDILAKAKEIGLTVVAITSDMGSANRALWTALGIHSSRESLVNRVPHPSDSSKWLYTFADVPHLIKNLKSMLLKHDIILPESTVKTYKLPSNVVTVNHIKALVDFQEHQDLKLAPKLTSTILDQKHFNSMKVSHALHVFSKSASAALRHLVFVEGYSDAFLTTAWFLEVTNHWFDLMSSRDSVMALSKRNTVQYAEALKFLTSFAEIISSCKFGEKGVWKPVQSGILMSTQSMLQLSDEILQTASFLLTSRLSQDCLENLFSTIRLKNPVPTPLEFKNALKLITVGQILHVSPNSNYEEDESSFLADFISNHKDEESNPDSLNETMICEFTSNADLSTAEQASLYYLCGYCIQSLKKKKQVCDICFNSCKKDLDIADPVTSFTALKEYKPGSLFYSSTDVYSLCKVIEGVIRQVEPLIASLSHPYQCIIDNVNEHPKAKAISLPTCHNIKDKIIAKFVTLRLRLLCQKLKARHAQPHNITGMGSRSMAMRQVVQKL